MEFIIGGFFAMFFLLIGFAMGQISANKKGDASG